jgi:hypothetical protein
MKNYTCNVYANEKDRLNMKLVTSETIETQQYLNDYIHSLNFRHIDWEEVEVRTSINYIFEEPDGGERGVQA